MTSEFIADLMASSLPLNEVRIIEPQDPKCRFLMGLQADAAGRAGYASAGVRLRVAAARGTPAARNIKEGSNLIASIVKNITLDRQPHQKVEDLDTQT
ncbi:hypothetical protein ABIB17_000756 [Arthrobacter sp. UYEF6]